MTHPQDVNAEIEELVLGQAVDREKFLEHVRLELRPALDQLEGAGINIAAFLIKHPVLRVLEINENLKRAYESLRGFVTTQLGIAKPKRKRKKVEEGRVLGQVKSKAQCQCALDAIRAYQALESIANAATVGGLGVETFDKFPDWIRRNKRDLRRPLEDFQESCGVDIGPGSPLTPILFQLDGLDALAEILGQFETQLRATQMLQNLFTALEEC